MPNLLILFGSQTGNAEEIAKMLRRTAVGFTGLEDTECSSMANYLKNDKTLDKLSHNRFVVFVVSNTGQGDPPDNARAFLRVLAKRKDSSWFQDLQYAILGLGDSNYDKFNETGRRLDSSLQERGATSFYQRGDADDGIGLEVVVEPWRKGLFPVIQENLATKSASDVAGSLAAVGANAEALGLALSHPFEGLSVSQVSQSLANIANRNDVAKVLQSRRKRTASIDNPDDAPRFLFSPLVLFGSQTGNGQEIGKRIVKEAKTTRGYLDARLMSMNDYAKADKTLATLPTEPVVIFIISTTGRGDPPDNARALIRVLRQKKGEKWLANLKFCLLGLGDTNYDDFNAAAKQLRGYLLGSGGQEVYRHGLADDGIGLDVVVEPWLAGMWGALAGLPLPPSSAPARKASSELVAPASPPAAKAGPSSPSSSSPAAAPPASSASPAPSNLAQLLAAKAASSQPTLHNSNPTPLSRPGGLTVGREGKEPNSEEKESLPAQPPSQPVKGAATGRLSRRRKDADEFQQCSLQLVLGNKGLDSVRSPKYGITRWSDADVDAELGGYTPEAPIRATLRKARFLTSAQSTDRRVLHLELDLPPESIVYAPGDAIGIWCPNEAKVVDSLLQRLKLDGSTIITQIQSNQKERSLCHISTPCTLRDALLHCCDLTSPPRKAFLRMLAEYCSDDKDKQKLLHYCNIKLGSADYLRDFMEGRPNFVEILQAFPSCLPPLAHVLELLPALLPRYYSISNSPTLDPSSIHIAFSLVRYKTNAPNIGLVDAPRAGLCTDWLYRLAKAANLLDSAGELEWKAGSRRNTVIGAERIDDTFALPVFLRRSNGFALPNDVTKPIIMIGPGTGVAPFRGFIQHRRQQQLCTGDCSQGWWRGMEIDEKDEKKEPEAVAEEADELGFVARNWSPPFVDVPSELLDDEEPDEEEPEQDCDVTPTKFGGMSLYFGCRHEDQDYLYKEELETALSSGALTELQVAFSRDPRLGKKVYVQHLLELQGPTVAKQIVDDKAWIYVCGDGCKMAKDVNQAVVELLVKHKSMAAKEAQLYVAGLMREGRYKQDIWS